MSPVVRGYLLTAAVTSDSDVTSHWTVATLRVHMCVMPSSHQWPIQKFMLLGGRRGSGIPLIPVPIEGAKISAMAIRHNRWKTQTELERVFCRWIYFHLRSKIYFWPSYWGGGDCPHGFATGSFRRPDAKTALSSRVGRRELL